MKSLLQKTIVTLPLAAMCLLVIAPGAPGQAPTDPPIHSTWSWPEGNTLYTDSTAAVLRVDDYPNLPDHVRWYDPQGNRVYFTSSGPGVLNRIYNIYYGGMIVGKQYFYYREAGVGPELLKYYEWYSGGVHAGTNYYFRIASEDRQTGQYRVEGCATATCENVLFTGYFTIDYRYKTYLPLALRQAN